MTFHFLRSGWLLLIFIFIPVLWGYLFKKNNLSTWRNVCDQHLLPYLIKSQSVHKEYFIFGILVMVTLLMIFSLAGPTWKKLPVPTFKKTIPRVILLDMSDVMQKKDLNPDRLSRAKFKLHDLFQKQDAGQFGLVVYTGEPFVVSPLTDDAKTIDALLPNLTPDVMPVEGNHLELALDEARALIKQAGFSKGEILVLTAEMPSIASIQTVSALKHLGINSSIIPVKAVDKSIDPKFKEFAKRGGGNLYQFQDTTEDIDAWLSKTNANHFVNNISNDMPVWRDEGRWFLIPVLLLLLPFFRKGYWS